MKVGDLVKFKNTGTIALITVAYAIESPGGYVELMVTDGSLNNTACADGFTSMSNSMLWRAADILK